MGTKRHKPDETVANLRQVEMLVGQCSSTVGRSRKDVALFLACEAEEGWVWFTIHS